MQQRIIPNLWFDTEAEEAAEFYCSVFPNSRVVAKTHYTEGAPREAGMVMTVEFELDGQRFVGINGGPQFTFDEAVSFQIDCRDQDEVDYEVFSDADPERARRAMEAMLKMKKLDVEALRAAADGVAAT